MKLPEEFCRRMQRLLGNEYEEFMLSYEQPRSVALRVNTSKIEVEDFINIAPFPLDPVPWTANGFYFREEDRPAKHPYYFAGLYYIQEPSAMIPAQILGVEPGDRVLDLCAAPGGKSTQIALDLKGQGILVANDISADRTKALTKNLELFGIMNAVVTNESPEKLAGNFPGYFTKILVDAPCSGEGMFRKDPDAARQWEAYSNKKCTVIQRDILNHAAKMLSPGGQLVYSTCTFAPEENEETVKDFLTNNKDFFLIDIPKLFGFDGGRPEWTDDGDRELAKSVRLWPHKVKGEGHFAALFQKRGTVIKGRNNPKAMYDKYNLEPYFSFVKENINIRLQGEFQLYSDHLYLCPYDIPNLNGLKVIKPGLYLGVFKKFRFGPSHSLALVLRKEAFKRTINMSANSREVMTYLKGETLNISGEKGWLGICVDGFPLGWGKQAGNFIKNHYPKGWRRFD